MLLPRHRRFFRCYINTVRFEELLLGAVEVFERQIFNEQLNKVGEVNLEDEAKVPVLGIDAIDISLKKILWMPVCLSLLQLILTHDTYFIPDRFRDHSLYAMEMACTQ